MLFELTRPVRQALSAHVTLDEVQRWIKLSQRPDGSFGETWLVLTPSLLLVGDAPSFAAPSFRRHLRTDVVGSGTEERGGEHFASIALRSGERLQLALRWADLQAFSDFARELTAQPAQAAEPGAGSREPGSAEVETGAAARGMPCLKCDHWTNVVQLEGVEVERCPRCRGIYLDRNELDLLTGTAGLTAGLVRDTSRCHACHCTISDGAQRCPACQSELPTFHCPKCRSLMRHVMAGDVVLELCTSCHGIWLDQGELDEVRRYTHGPGSSHQDVPAPAAAAASDRFRLALDKPDIANVGPGVTCLRCALPAAVERMGQVEVDLCHRCGGLFLDRGELEQLTGIGDMDRFFAGSDPRCPACLCVLGASETSCPACGKALPHPSCPRCRQAMRHVAGGEILVEHCLACGGIWLDRGELNKVEAWLRAHATPRDRPERCARCAAVLHDASEGYLSGDGVVCHRCVVEIDIEDSQRFHEQGQTAEWLGGAYGGTSVLNALRQLIAYFQGRDAYW